MAILDEIQANIVQLAESASAYEVRSPALLIIGEVAALATSLAWFGRPPLAARLPLSSTVPEALAV